ncbi:hypothetical protein C4D60_Mb10t22950 [Musa balbisiana]|uniref:Uncharacterized protein n=1 Tax=Musa balbisiana TaxID=52838 RepID=A0A4S8IZ58_MUSBA|nr:hypothetical protein C4D60_Mb10t22950 [Musa balbisiana]
MMKPSQRKASSHLPISLTTAFFTQSKPSASLLQLNILQIPHPFFHYPHPKPSPNPPFTPDSSPRSDLSALKPLCSSSQSKFLSAFSELAPQLIPRWRLFNPNAARPARALERSNLFDPKSLRSTSQIRFMSSSAAGKPPQGSSPAAISPDSPSPIQIVSTFASPFDESPPHIDSSSSIRKPLSLWSGLYHSPVSNAL